MTSGLMHFRAPSHKWRRSIDRASRLPEAELVRVASGHLNDFATDHPLARWAHDRFLVIRVGTEKRRLDPLILQLRKSVLATNTVVDGQYAKFWK
jgi:hypothetical protein